MTDVEMTLKFKDAVDLENRKRSGEIDSAEHYRELFTLFKELADAGCKKAPWYVALMYQSGVCVEKDDTKAIRYYTLAAKNGSVVAEKILKRDYNIKLNTGD